MSKHLNVQLPKQEEGKELTRDYTGSDLHRFRRKAQINTKNVNPPSIVLHVANLHENATEQELRDLFGAQQPTVLLPTFVIFVLRSLISMIIICDMLCDFNQTSDLLPLRTLNLTCSTNIVHKLACLCLLTYEYAKIIDQFYFYTLRKYMLIYRYVPAT